MFCCRPTSPFRIRSDLIACIDQFEKSSARSIMSVTLPWSAPKIICPLNRN